MISIIGRNVCFKQHQLLNRFLQRWCIPVVVHRGYCLDKCPQKCSPYHMNLYNNFLGGVPLHVKHVRFKNYHVSEIFIEFNDRAKLRDDFQLSFAEWTELRDRMEKENPYFANGMDHALMKMAATQNKPELAKSLMEFLKHIGKTSISTTVQFMAACCSKYEDLVLKELDDLENDPKLKILWSECAIVIYAVTQTRAWEKAKIFYEWLPRIDSSAFMSSTFYIMRAALKHNDYRTFFEFLHQYQLRNNDCSGQLDKISDLLYEEWQNGLYGLDVLLELLKVHNMYLREHQAAALQKHVSQTSPDTVAMTTIDKQSRWQCDQCGEYLTQDQPITVSEVKRLGNHLAMQAFATKAKYYTTQPKDHSYFKNMLKHCGPFDYVIDGENIVLAPGFSKIMNDFLSAVEEFRSQGKRILVIHRAQTVKNNILPKAYITRVKNSCILFLVSRKTYDDVYTLTAAMLSGKHCYVASRDNFRDHIAKLDIPNRQLFWLWQKQCHIQIPADVEKADTLWKYPNARCVTHESELHWHVPYKKSQDEAPNENEASETRREWADNLFPPHTFLCIRKPSGYVTSEEVMKVRTARNWVCERTKEKEAAKEDNEITTSE